MFDISWRGLLHRSQLCHISYFGLKHVAIVVLVMYTVIAILRDKDSLNSIRFHFLTLI